MFRGDMGGRHCKTEEDETLEVCTGLAHTQRVLNINEEQGKLIFWLRMGPKLKELTNKDNLKELKKEKKTLKNKEKNS